MNVKNKPLSGLLLIISFIVLSCTTDTSNSNNQNNKVLELDPKYQAFNNLTAIANCVGPNFKYTTEVHSSIDKYTYFKQEYEGTDEDFKVVIFEGKTGYTIGNDGVRGDTISKESIEIIRGHEFHKIHMIPDQYFKNVVYKDDVHFQEKLCEKYSALDLSNNHVDIFFDRKEKLLEGFTLQNPIDTTELIEIFYKDWLDSDFGKLVKKVEIIQGGKDTFHFDFEQVIINDEHFKKINFD